MTARIALLGGSYDPVHLGHVALGLHFATLLDADELRVIPAGAPWQKGSIQATPQQRADMAQLAFEDAAATNAAWPEKLKVVIDRQEIARAAPTYTIDTLRQLRGVFGPQASIAFLMGADQLRRLDTWHDWRQLFDHAHILVAARPGFSLEEAQLPREVADAFAARLGSLESIRNTPHGLTYLAQDFAVDISATQIRAALQRGDRANSHISPRVLDYIEQHNLYKS